MTTEEMERLEELKAEHLAELRELEDSYYQTFDDLQEAIPSLPPEAYDLMSENILVQYSLWYKFFDEKYRTDIEREIAKMAMRREVLVPFHWHKGWGLFKKYKKNTAERIVYDQVYKETNEFFARIEAEIAEERYQNAQAALPEEPAEEEWEIVGEIEEPAEGEKQAENVAAGAVAESPETAEKSPQNAPESAERAKVREATEPAEPAADEAPSEEETPPKKPRRKRKCA